MYTDRLYYLTQDLPDRSHIGQVELAAASGISWIQLRTKIMDRAELLSVAREASSIVQGTGSRLIINDHVEVALECGAHGVHLGQLDMPADATRQVLGKDAVIGGTANTLDDVRHCLAQGVDYIGLGPFRFTATKDRLSPVLGPDGVAEIAAALREMQIGIPVFVIGGILPGDVANLLGPGIYGVAVASAINRSDDPRSAIEAFKNEINNCMGRESHPSPAFNRVL